MIKNLRRKFILIYMTLVIPILLILFTILYVTNQKRYEQNSNRVLEHALMAEWQDMRPKVELKKEEEPPPSDIDKNMAFIVDLNTDKVIDNADTGSLNVSDSFVETAVEQTLEENALQGTLPDLKLKYIMMSTPSGIRIAFKDYSFETREMKNLLQNSVWLFLAGTLAFFIISLFLSRWALAPVEKAWQQQHQFIADVSHELKTPLTVILDNLGILSSHKNDTIKEQYRWLENAQMEAGRMRELLDNLLFLARFNDSQIPVVFSEIDLSCAVLSCILPFESLAYENGITLKEEIDSGISLTGDESQLKQLTVILLDNACKYAGKNGCVTVRLSRKTDRPEHIILKVTNTGDVIPKDEQEHIFERFYRSNKSRIRAKGGYGLGLAIARTIAEQHYGTIDVSSSEEDGTVFTIEFHSESI